jgi:hypothetical protein
MCLHPVQQRVIALSASDQKAQRFNQYGFHIDHQRHRISYLRWDFKATIAEPPAAHFTITGRRVILVIENDFHAFDLPLEGQDFGHHGSQQVFRPKAAIFFPAPLLPQGHSPWDQDCRANGSDGEERLQPAGSARMAFDSAQDGVGLQRTGIPTREVHVGGIS